jgi:hypothetical protein
LFGRHAQTVHADVLDLQHGLQFVPMATVTGSDHVEVCRDADVLVLTGRSPSSQGGRRLSIEWTKRPNGSDARRAYLPERAAGNTDSRHNHTGTWR